MRHIAAEREPMRTLSANNQAEQTERSILSAILNYDHAMELASRSIKAHHFRNSQHKEIYKACCDLHIDGLKIDLISTSDRLKQRGTLSKIGGPEYLSDLLAVVSSSANLEQHSNILIDNYVGRSVLDLTRGLNGNSSGHELLSEVQGRLHAIEAGLPTTGSEDPIFTDETFKRFVDELTTEPSESDLLFSTGVAPLDRIIGGFERGTVAAIQGLYKAGKTKFAIQIIVMTSRRGTPVGFLSLEMSEKRVRRWLLSHVCEIDSRFFRRPYQPEWNSARSKYFETARDRGRELVSLPILVNDIRRPTIDQIEAIISAWSRRDVGLVVIDYFERMQLGREWKDEGAVTSRLADIATKYNVALIYLDQLNKSAETSTETTLAHSRGSVTRCADADLLIQMRNVSREERDVGDDGKKADIEMLIIAREVGSGRRIKGEIEADLSIGSFSEKA